MFSRSQPCLWHFSAAAESAGFHQVSECSQIHRAPEPFGFFQHRLVRRLRQSLDPKDCFLHSQVRGWHASFGSFPAPGPVVALCSFVAPTRIRRSVFLHRSGLSRWSLLSLGRVRAGLCFSGARFFRGALALLMVIAVRPAVVPTRLQPVPVNSLLIN